MQKKKASNIVTRNILKGELEASEKRLEKRFEKKFVTKFDLQGVEERIDESGRKHRDEILTKLDGVMGEVQTMREENTVGTHQIAEVRERVDNHEERITHFEKAQQGA